MRPPFYALFSECGTLRAETSNYKQDKGGEQVAMEYFGDMPWVDKQRRKPEKLGTEGTFSGETMDRRAVYRVGRIGTGCTIGGKYQNTFRCPRVSAAAYQDSAMSHHPVIRVGCLIRSFLRRVRR